MLQLAQNSTTASTEERTFNRRRFERFALPIGYTTVTVQRSHENAVSTLTGHAYDISESGVRFELDEALDLGECVAASIMLPCEREPVFVNARVVWLNDAIDDPGPRRMALQFDEFTSPADRHRLVGYLSRGRLARAA